MAVMLRYKEESCGITYKVREETMKKSGIRNLLGTGTSGEGELVMKHRLYVG